MRYARLTDYVPIRPCLWCNTKFDGSIYDYLGETKPKDDYLPIAIPYNHNHNHNQNADSMIPVIRVQHQVAYLLHNGRMIIPIYVRCDME